MVSCLLNFLLVAYRWAFVTFLKVLLKLHSETFKGLFDLVPSKALEKWNVSSFSPNLN